MVTLSRRSARFIGFFLIRATSSRLPTIRPACGPPRSLSPEEVTNSTTATIASPAVRRLVRQAETGEIDQSAAPEILDHRQPAGMRQLGERRRFDGGREP